VPEGSQFSWRPASQSGGTHAGQSILALSSGGREVFKHKSENTGSFGKTAWVSCSSRSSTGMPSCHSPRSAPRSAATSSWYGALITWLPPYCDGRDILTLDGDLLRGAGLLVFIIGGALRVAPMFILGPRGSLTPSCHGAGRSRVKTRSS
jgi:hypothetical protein